MSTEGSTAAAAKVPQAGSRLQQLMARSGSFPIDVASRLLAAHAKQGDVVLDPFCGKGTSLLAARALGMIALGMDVAPDAVVCTRAKLVAPSLPAVMEYIDAIDVSNPDGADIPENVSLFYHPLTLQQLLGARAQLLRDYEAEGDLGDIASFVLGCLLGILHGRSSMSLSIPSSHAYAMAPNYVRRYASEYGLVAPVRDVRACLRQKALRTWEALPAATSDSRVAQRSAAEVREEFPDRVGRVDVVITSPPYLDAQTYAKDAWLRFWLLRVQAAGVSSSMIQTGSTVRYQDQMAPIFASIRDMLRPGGLVICISGDVKNRRTGAMVETGGILASVAAAAGLRVIAEERHVVPSHARYFHELSGSNGHSKRMLVERVFVAERDP